MSFFDYEYFCGSNTVVHLGNTAVLEAAAISYSIQESKRPIYGYSSRHFDAVARGQVIIQGSLIVNFIHQDYLYRVLQVAKREDVILQTDEFVNTKDLPPGDSFRKALLNDTVINKNDPNFTLVQEQELLKIYQDQIWGSLEEDSTPAGMISNLGLHDRNDGVNIKITFGLQDFSTSYNGRANRVLSDVFFTGHGMAIQINENTIVEEYSFFARDVFSFENANPNGLTTVVSDEAKGKESL